MDRVRNCIFLGWWFMAADPIQSGAASTGMAFPTTFPYLYHDIVARMIPGGFLIACAIGVGNAAVGTPHLIAASILANAKANPAMTTAIALPCSYFVGVCQEGCFGLVILKMFNYWFARKALDFGMSAPVTPAHADLASELLETHEPLLGKSFERSTRHHAEGKMTFYTALSLQVAAVMEAATLSVGDAASLIAASFSIVLLFWTLSLHGVSAKRGAKHVAIGSSVVLLLGLGVTSLLQGQITDAIKSGLIAGSLTAWLAWISSTRERRRAVEILRCIRQLRNGSTGGTASPPATLKEQAENLFQGRLPNPCEPSS